MRSDKRPIKKIRDLNKNMGYNFPNQVAIDLIERAESLTHKEPSEEPIMRDQVGALAYRVGCVLDVYDPKHEYDIGLLRELKEALEEWRDAIEFVNKTLGLPPQGRKP